MEVKPPPSLFDVLGFVSSSELLSPVRRRDYRSSILRFCGYVGKSAEMIPADSRHLSQCLQTINPAQHGISVKTQQNVKSNLLGAVLLFKDSTNVVLRKQALSDEWQSLFVLLPDLRYRNGLSRFIHYLSVQSSQPNGVDDSVVSKFIDSLSNGSFLSDQKIRECHRRTTRLWNEASQLVAVWPDTLLSVPDYRKPRSTYPLSAFPDSFQSEVEEHLVWLEVNDLFAKHGPPRRCKPRTIDLRRSQIQPRC